MKLKFKYAMMAVAALTLGLTSCSNDDNETPEKAAKSLSIKIAGVTHSGTKAIEGPGKTSGSITLTGGSIFIINHLGAITKSEPLSVTAATGSTGQVISGIAADSRVYIIGNIPTSFDITTLHSFADIQAATSAMTAQTDYTKAALANSDGQAATITLGSGNTASATISIKPLISRMELTQVKGTGNIKGFTVAGVYVDSYYPAFTYVGGYSGTIFEQEQSTIFTGIGDNGTWAANSSSLIANPGTNKVWAHNVASGALPRFIIALTNVKYINSAGNLEDKGSIVYYLTVTGYDSGALTAFERGKIYRVGGTNGIEFDEDDLGLTPNPVDIDLTLKVVVEEWILETPTAEL